MLIREKSWLAAKSPIMAGTMEMPSSSHGMPMVPRMWPAVFIPMVPMSTPKAPASRPRAMLSPVSEPSSIMPQMATTSISSGPIFSTMSAIGTMVTNSRM